LVRPDNGSTRLLKSTRQEARWRPPSDRPGRFASARSRTVGAPLQTFSGAPGLCDSLRRNRSRRCSGADARDWASASARRDREIVSSARRSWSSASGSVISLRICPDACSRAAGQLTRRDARLLLAAERHSHRRTRLTAVTAQDGLRGAGCWFLSERAIHLSEVEALRPVARVAHDRGAQKPWWARLSPPQGASGRVSWVGFSSREPTGSLTQMDSPFVRYRQRERRRRCCCSPACRVRSPG
jgi:hypothetical protein